MKNYYRQQPRVKTKLKTKLIIVTGVIGLCLTLSLGWLVYLNLTQSTRTQATNNNGGSNLNNGEIISEFTWDSSPATKATLGPDASRISPNAISLFGGKSSTGGLAPGNPTQDINLEIDATPVFDIDGIDVSIDFRRLESSGSFITRGKSLDFGFKKGFLTINYRVNSPAGGFETISAITDYEIPQDNVFRNYRFIYNPVSGKAEVFVNNIVVWSYEGTKNSSMYWKDAGSIMICKGVDGGGNNMAIADNLIIRTAGNISPLSESLISFTVSQTDDKVALHWTTTANEKIDYFTIERSVDGINFANLKKVYSNQDKSAEQDYITTDPIESQNNLIYYRIRQTFKDGKFSIHPVTAIRLKTDKTFAIDKVAPDPFHSGFNLSYFIPSPGRIWIQLTDEAGAIKSSETFEAGAGKNYYSFVDKNNLGAGRYTINVVYNDKRMRASIVKL